jgi:uncharacterized cupredoxin-like copper-binding protein
MKSSLPRVLVALFALTFVLAACASESGSQWTFAPSDGGDQAEASTEPSAAAESQETAEPAEPEGSAAPEEPAQPEEPAEPEQSAAPQEPAEPPSGEARVIDLQADSALRFTDPNGQPVSDIAVTPGETVVFRIENTAGFGHDFWIGTDAELAVPSGTTDVGIPEWSTGVQELEWVVPDDVTDLKFACTVPGHYYTMQGTFSSAAGTPATPEEPAEPAEADAPAEPEPSAEPGSTVESDTPAEAEDTAAPEEPAEPAEPATPAEPAAPADGEARVIELEADAAIRFLQDGEQIREIGVTPGETVIFRVDNTAGFPHNFYIGPDEELQVMAGTTDTGIPDWDTGVQELEWVVPEDLTNVRFACTVPGHYYTMQGDFVVSE